MRKRQCIVCEKKTTNTVIADMTIVAICPTCQRKANKEFDDNQQGGS